MAALSVIHPTYLDYTKRQDPDRKIAKIIEILAQTNEVLKDGVVVEGNLEVGHRTTIRTGLPAPTWRKLYGGVQPTKSTTAQITASCGMLEAYAEVDKALADLNNNTADFRMSEDMAQIEGMSQEMASTVFNGDESTEPEAFTGFGPMFNSSTAANAENIFIEGSNDTDATSIWLVGWGTNTVHFVHPKGSKMGLQMTDKGQVTCENIDGSSGRAEIYRTHYRWDMGLVVRDWRYVVRIQYDPDDIVATAASGPDLNQLMGKALRRIPSLSLCRPVFYCNRDSFDMIELQAMKRAEMAYHTVNDAQGISVPAFRGVPIRRCDAITTTESTVP